MTRDTIEYDYVDYVDYDHACGADKVKKILEFEMVRSRVNVWQIQHGDTLDIGCATGRYPLWFAQQGFNATGYDRSPDAIRFCRERSADKPYRSRLLFETRDIVAADVPTESFIVITSMMGTVNHLDPRQRAPFLAKCTRGLQSNGHVMLSCWNPQSPHQGLLSLYDRDEKALLLHRLLPADKMASLVLAAGLIDVTIHYFCLLPDDSYDSWPPDLSDEEVAALEATHAELTPSQSGQMYLITGRKP